jgi:hypothetical protein
LVPTQEVDSSAIDSSTDGDTVKGRTRRSSSGQPESRSSGVESADAG